MSQNEIRHKHVKLSQLPATAICGNDILSSALYVSGIAAMFAGVYAPIILLLIGVVLFLYKAVYTEVVEALPINGGAYNCLLNGTSKTFAAIAGVMTILSYIATAVISAKVGVEYLGTIISLPIIPITIVLLFAFAILVITGLKDSAKVALFIFVIHIIVLSLFVIFGIVHFLKGNSFFTVNLMNTVPLVSHQGGLWKTIFLAFSASLLGVSGFESSANFVEEQKKGVFRKTLRNMLLGVALFNPLISLVTLNSLHLGEIAAAKDFLLSDAALVIGGQIFQYIVVIDAFLVLSGAVLTAFVGVSGLIFRMSADGCLPYFLTKKNSKDSYPLIIVMFFLLCSSILVITKGNLLSLAGVYTISFLGVMSSFALGNLMLKETRTELKRTYSAPFLFVLFALIATTVGIIGNIFIDPNNLVFFAWYFIPALAVVLFIIYQDYVLKGVMRFTKYVPFIHHYILQWFGSVVEGRFVVFIRNSSRLYPILEYINRNETGWNITFVHCKDSENEEEMKNIKELIPQLQKAGVFPYFAIEYLSIREPFGPDVVKKISKQLKISKNRIFIGSIHHYHDFEYSDLGGVRIIL